MKLNFDFLKQTTEETAKAVGVAAAITAMSSQGVQAVEKPVEDSKEDKKEMVLGDTKEVGFDSKTYVASNTEVNEAKELDLQIAKEAIMNADKGAYISKDKAGYVFVSEKIDPKSGVLHVSNYGFSLKAYQITDKSVGGYDIYTVGISDNDANKTDVELLKGIEDSGIKISSRFNETSPIGVPYVYRILRDKMSPVEAQMILEKANSSINKETLASLLISSKEYKDFSNSEKEIMNKDILAFSQTPVVSTDQTLASIKE